MLAEAARYFVLFSLTAYAFVASLAVCVRARLAGRTETLLAALLSWNFVILVPIHALGVTGHLTALNLGLLSTLTSSIALALSFARTDRAQHARDTASALFGVLRLPADALIEATRARSIAAIAIAMALGLLVLTVIQTWLIPADGWDPIWYHDTMVGYAIQLHGYRPPPLPLDMTQQANGYPRNCEMTNLWFVIFTDRRLLELPNTIAAIVIVFATYLMVLRYSANRVTSMGWACALILMPGFALQLRSSYIDVHVCAFTVAAVYFASRPTLRLRDALITAMCLSLLIGGKGPALAWVPPLAVFTVARLALAHGRQRPLASVSVLTAGVALIVGMASVTYVRNWFNFHNPLWPIQFTSERLHISWPGVASFESMEWNKPLLETWKQMVVPPVPGHDFQDTRQFGYGFAIPLVLLPLAFFSLAVAVVYVLLGWLTILPRGAKHATAVNLLWTTGFALFAAYTSRALWTARYNLHLLPSIVCVVAWLLRIVGARGASEGSIGFVTLSHVVSLFWAAPAVGGMTLAETYEFAKLPARVRATISPMIWSTSPDAAARRDQELGPGDVVVFSDGFMFPSLLWNERYSNMVVYVSPGSPEQTNAAVEQVHAKWLVAPENTALWEVAKRHPETWELFGHMYNATPQPQAYRRR